MDLLIVLIGAALMWAGSKAQRAGPVVVVLGISDKALAGARVEAALWAGAKVGSNLFVTTGKGAGIDGLSEADWMAGQLRAKSKTVIVERDATNTFWNVKNVSKILPKGTNVVVVSTSNHVISAAWCLTWKYGIPAKWVQWPTQTIHSVPGKLPRECDRAGCCWGKE